MMNQLRANVRNFLVGLTMAEVRRELDLSVAMGDTARAGYIDEWLQELLAEQFA